MDFAFYVINPEKKKMREREPNSPVGRLLLVLP